MKQTNLSQADKRLTPEPPNRFDSGPKTAIAIDGQKYHLNTAYDGCCMVWDGYGAMQAGELSQEAYCALVIKMMYHEPRPPIWSEEALKLVHEFLNYYSDRGGDRKTKIPPISIRQDWPMMVSSFLLLGIDLRTDMIDHGKFMYYLRNLPERCEYAVIMHLRRQWYDNRAKMTKEEKEACARIGWDKIKIRGRNKPEAEESAELSEFKRLINENRASRGLPPI